MQAHHWLLIFIMLAIGYYLGGKYPGLLANIGL
jgi:hypothetical protein